MKVTYQKLKATNVSVINDVVEVMEDFITGNILLFQKSKDEMKDIVLYPQDIKFIKFAEK